MPDDETPGTTTYVMTFTASGVVGTTNPDEKDAKPTSQGK